MGFTEKNQNLARLKPEELGQVAACLVQP